MKKLVSVFMGIAFALPILSSAAVFQGSENYALNPGESVSDDLYAVGGTVNLAGNVAGDAVVAGGNLVVTGSVTGDLMVAGGSVTLLGNIGDDIRVVGGQLTIGGEVKDDIVVAGGSIHLISNALVHGDVVAAGGNINVSGKISGNFRPKAEMVEINGPIEGDVEIWATKKVVIGPSAVINGSLVYHAPREAQIDPGAKIVGGVKFEETKNLPRISKRAALGVMSLGFLLKLIAVIIAAYVLLKVWKHGSELVLHKSGQKFWPTAGRGIVLLIVTPIVGIILLATLVGSVLGILTLLIYGILLLLSGLYSGVVFGAWLWKHVFKKAEEDARTSQLVVGTILLALIGLIPFVGWIICMLFFLSTLGSLAEYGMVKLKRE